MSAALATPGAGDVVAWQARMTAGGFTSQWSEWPMDKEREPKIGRWSVEYRPLYAHPAPAHAVDALSDMERKALDGLLCNLAHEAGDVHDTAPPIGSDEDGHWAYHQYWAITKLQRKPHALAAPAASQAGEVDDAMVERFIKTALERGFLGVVGTAIEKEVRVLLTATLATQPPSCS